MGHASLRNDDDCGEGTAAASMRSVVSSAGRTTLGLGGIGASFASKLEYGPFFIPPS